MTLTYPLDQLDSEQLRTLAAQLPQRVDHLEKQVAYQDARHNRCAPGCDGQALTDSDRVAKDAVKRYVEVLIDPIVLIFSNTLPRRFEWWRSKLL